MPRSPVVIATHVDAEHLRTTKVVWKILKAVNVEKLEELFGSFVQSWKKWQIWRYPTEICIHNEHVWTWQPNHATTSHFGSAPRPLAGQKKNIVQQSAMTTCSWVTLCQRFSSSTFLPGRLYSTLASKSFCFWTRDFAMGPTSKANFQSMFCV